ncbi:outer membrane protein [Mucilaginibacter sp. BT774]|uniref:outer membrane protein n=1 Tax=Mucilaginibacter sp. BT774 TaxID=3062276 RepID=UPI002676AB9D|nr:hypothetical protein [Mucilaginibacter sp. BT774]MDO3627094.1 hypothetical protein [Mucilaginibacter sp. BT774]
MKLNLTALFLIVPFALFAQSNYHPGYILKNNRDTLKGFINYREWRQNPKSIDFKVNKTEKQVLQFNPQSIKEFQITGLETYVAYTGEISTNQTNFSNLPEKLDTTLKSDTIFLQRLATGSHMTLYKYTDEIKTRFFVAETNGSPEELKYYEYYTNAHEIVDKQVFKGQLISYINKLNLQIPGLVNKLDQARYEQTDLEQLINEVNNNDKKTFTKKASSSRFFAGISVGRTTTEVSEITIAGLPTDILHGQAATSPRINLGVDFFDNPNVQRFVFRGEIAFSYANPNYAYQIARVDGTSAHTTYTFNQYTASVAPQILFNFYNKDDFKVYIDAGIAFNFSSYTNNKFVIDESDIAGPDLAPFWINFPLQAGMVLNKKIEVCFTYINKASFSRTSTFDANNQTVSLGVKFLFGKK